MGHCRWLRPVLFQSVRKTPTYPEIDGDAMATELEKQLFAPFTQLAMPSLVYTCVFAVETSSRQTFFVKVCSGGALKSLVADSGLVSLAGATTRSRWQAQSLKSSKADHRLNTPMDALKFQIFMPVSWRRDIIFIYPGPSNYEQPKPGEREQNFSHGG
ncbi:unnamed protein product [Clonostachys rosea]|uniref:Uncharacterized protein n=1 Tax=Bionectria ochroleuca TaxID=29856 RepID=A0ABY6UXH2_BIOOC|nr:unnamed protein product [Clonostachys rosea]